MPILAAPLIALGASSVGVGATVGGGLATAGMIAGVAGTVLSVVGKVTKSKLLGQIGMGLGIAGAVLGLGAVAGGMGMFGETVKSGLAQGASSLSGAAGSASAVTPAAGSIEASRQVGSLSVNPGTVPLQPTAVSTTLQGPSLTVPGHAAGSLPSQLQAPGLIQTAPNAGAFGGPGIGVSAPTQAFAPLPGVTSGGLPTSMGTGSSGINSNQMLADSLARQVNATPSGGLGDWFKNLDPTSKTLLINTAGQGVSGTVGGIFSSIQADRQAELLEQINRENRQYQKWQSEQAPGLIQFQH